MYFIAILKDEKIIRTKSDNQKYLQDITGNEFKVDIDFTPVELSKEKQQICVYLTIKDKNNIPVHYNSVLSTNTSIDYIVKITTLLVKASIHRLVKQALTIK